MTITLALMPILAAPSLAFAAVGDDLTLTLPTQIVKMSEQEVRKATGGRSSYFIESNGSTGHDAKLCVSALKFEDWWSDQLLSRPSNAQLAQSKKSRARAQDYCESLSFPHVTELEIDQFDRHIDKCRGTSTRVQVREIYPRNSDVQLQPAFAHVWDPTLKAARATDRPEKEYVITKITCSLFKTAPKPAIQAKNAGDPNVATQFTDRKLGIFKVGMPVMHLSRDAEYGDGMIVGVFPKERAVFVAFSKHAERIRVSIDELVKN